MAHGGYGRVADRQLAGPLEGRRPKSLAVDKKPKPKAKAVSSETKFDPLNVSELLVQSELGIHSGELTSFVGTHVTETGSEDDGLLELSDDDFFLNGSSQVMMLKQTSTREQASSASGKATSGMSSDERTQTDFCSCSFKSVSTSLKDITKIGISSSKKAYIRKADISTSSNSSNSIDRSSFRKRGPVDSNTGNSGNLSSNSDARKPRRKRRPKKKKQ